MHKNIRNFVLKITAKVLLLVVISVIVFSLLQSPVITNKMAMGQLENSDGLFILWDTYNKISPIISIVYGCIVAIWSLSVIYDIYKFVKTFKSEKE